MSRRTRASVWPPSGRRSVEREHAEDAGGERDRREHEHDRPVERMGAAAVAPQRRQHGDRSRPRRRPQAAATARRSAPPPALRRSLGSRSRQWYSAGRVRALLVKMGLSAYFASGRRWSSVTGTGRCEPRRAFLAICRGERSREARCDDPPSSGPCRFWGLTPQVSDTCAATLAAWSRRSSSRPPAATAPASSAPSRRSRRRSTSTGRPSTSASRSSTTSTSSATSRRAARCSSTRRPRCRRARRSSSPPTASRRRCTRTPRRARLHTIDATCPLVTKVHVQARRYAAEGYTVVLIGHAGHEEVVGTMGEAPDSIVLVESVDDVERLDVRPAREARLRDADDAVGRRDRRDHHRAARVASRRSTRRSSEDICYATSNRQWAVKEMLGEIDLLLVIGSRNSSNSNRLVEVARAGGVAAHLIDDETRDRRGVDRRRRGRRRHVAAPPRPRSSSSASATGSARAASSTSSRTASSTRTSSSGCRSSCAASSRSPRRRTKAP